MTCGGIVYETKGRDDQAEIASTAIETFPGKAAAAFGVQPVALFKAFCKPRIKVGPASRPPWPLEVLLEQFLIVSSNGLSRSVMPLLLTHPSRRQTSALCSTLLDLRSLSTMD